MSSVERIAKSHFSILKFDGGIDKECCDSLTMILESIINDEKDKIIILDFKEVLFIAPTLYTKLFQLFETSTSKGIAYYTINVDKVLQDTMESKCIKDRFNITKSIKEKLMSLNPTKKRIELDVSFVNPFLKAAIDTFGIQANLKVLPGKLSKGKSLGELDVELVGSIDINSEYFNGKLLICFPKDVFLSIYNTIFGEEESELSDDVKDAIAEFTNITLGQAKATLNKEKGIEIERAIPSVYESSAFDEIDVESNDSIMIPLATQSGTFYIFILFE